MNMNKAQRNLLVIMAVIILILGIEWLSNGTVRTPSNPRLRDMGKLIGELLTVIPAGLLIFFALGYRKIEKKGNNE